MKKIADPRTVTGNSPAFTLIELLVVIAIIGVLAAFTLPVLKGLKRTQVIKEVSAEMAQLETAIDSYKAVYGFYPPDNSKCDPSNLSSLTNAMMSPLYFELLGVTNNNGIYYTLDGSASVSSLPPPAPSAVQNAFGVSGFINQMKSGAGEDAPAARSFLSGLRNNRYMSATNHSVLATVFVTSVGGPDQNYMPFSLTPNFNPWRYVCPGINNPSSYDLWIELVISGKTNLVCNWSRQVQINSPLP